jgi:hypothetical protein
MAEISQRTIATMIVLFDHLGCYDPVGYTAWDEGPIITATKLRTILYSHNFDRKLLDRFQFLDWNFAHILPALRDNSIWGSISNPRTAVQVAQANQGRNETILRSLAEVLPSLENWTESLHYGAFRAFLSSLQMDGFTLSGGVLADADTEIVDIPAEVSAIEGSIAHSRHDHTQLLMHHLHTAQRQFAKAEWGPSAGEFRKFYEEILRGVWRFTLANNPKFLGRIEKPGFRDLMNWLQDSGFFTNDEKDAYGSAFGFLSLGNHPGLPDPYMARLCMILALTLGHACLQKMARWNGKQFLAS